MTILAIFLAGLPAVPECIGNIPETTFWFSDTCGYQINKPVIRHNLGHNLDLFSNLGHPNVMHSRSSC
jgi:hypothetical protein